MIKPKSYKQHISPEEWDAVQEEAEAAAQLLNDPKFAFFRRYLKAATDSVRDILVENRIKEYIEEIKVSDTVIKKYKYLKEEQLNELSGKYKFIQQLLSDLQRFVDLPEQTKKAAARGKVVIETNQEKDTG